MERTVLSPLLLLLILILILLQTANERSLPRQSPVLASLKVTVPSAAKRHSKLMIDACDPQCITLRFHISLILKKWKSSCVTLVTFHKSALPLIFA